MAERTFTLAEVEAMVTRATDEATRHIAAKKVWWWACVGFALAALIAAVLVYNNGHANCSLITKIARVSEEESRESAASTKNFEAKSRNRFGLSQHDFEKLVREGRERRERHLAALKDVAHTNCSIPLR